MDSVLTKDSERKILAFERKFYKKIMRIGFQKVMNKERLNRNLLREEIQRKLQPFGHICRMSDSRKINLLVFDIMQRNNKAEMPQREWAVDLLGGCITKLPEILCTRLKPNETKQLRNHQTPIGAEQRF